MKKSLWAIFLGILLCACSSPTVTIKENIVIEYGSELQVEDFTDQEGISVKEVNDFDSKEIGEQTVKVIFTDAEEHEIEQDIKLEVKDTKNPEIVLKEDSVLITQDDEFDPVSNIESVKDPVDGDIAISDDPEITNNGYVIYNEVDTSTPGEYTASVTAYDINGNKAESSYTVTVIEKEEPYIEPKPEVKDSSNATSSNVQAVEPSQTQDDQQRTRCESRGGAYSEGICTWYLETPEIDLTNHVHARDAIEGKWFVDPDELDAWAKVYRKEQGDKGNHIGAAYYVHKCTCGKYGIVYFY